MQREPLRERMRGRWTGILPELGVPAGFLNRKHQPCPMCAGKDRARFTDKDGAGTYFCNQCGAGDGIALVMKINGWDFKQAAERIEALIGTVKPQAAKPKSDGRAQLRAQRSAWNAAQPIGNAVRRYMASRGIDVGDPLDLRETSNHEMLALLRDVDGKGCQIHRTLLTADGRKADVEKVRMFMPGSIPKGAAVRLTEHGETIGIAEGIETAYSAAILFDVPCWAALNATLMRSWEAPAGTNRVIVFADNDANCTGQAAAYDLARRLASKVSVSVEIPKNTDTDWNDVLRERARKREPA